MNGRRVLAVLAMLLAAGVYVEARRAPKCVISVNIVDRKVEAVPIIRCAPAANIRWIVTNADDANYDVLFYEFKYGGAAKNPTNKTEHPKRIDSGQSGPVGGAKIRPRGDFGANLPLGTYKYSIRLRARGSGTNLHVLDPELEVVEPGIIK